MNAILDALNFENAGLKIRARTLDAELTEAAKDIASLQAQLTKAHARIEELETHIDELNNGASAMSYMRDKQDSKLAAAKAVLADCRPLVKGRLLDLDGPHGDASLLVRIADVLEDK